MASGSSSSGRLPVSSSRPLGFGSDDVLRSYDDLVDLNASSERRPNSAGEKDFRENRLGKPSQSIYGQPEGFNKQELVFVIERCMKKYTDKLVSIMEGITVHLKQLEGYCYDLEKSVGELHSEFDHNTIEMDLKLKSLEKHLHDVHRSVQILRDKQELEETQKELAKLQLAQKDSSVTADQKKDNLDATNKQLVLALPQQPVIQPPVAPAAPARVPEPLYQPYKEQPSQHPVPTFLTVQQPSYLAQGGGFYSQQPSQVPNQPPPPQPVPQSQTQLNPQAEARYMPQVARTQDQPMHTPPLQQTHAVSPNQSPFTGYPQQWSQQSPQQFPRPGSQPPQHSSAYPPYQPSQPGKMPGEPFQESPPTPVAYSTGDTGSYGYGRPHSSLQQLQRQVLPPTSMGPPGSQLSGYNSQAPYPPHSSTQGYSSYGPEGGGRPAVHSQPLYGGGYPPSNIPASRNQQPPPGHPFGELMEKAMNMGYPQDVVAGAIYRMEATGQPPNFNVLLDMLNPRAPGAAAGGWSG